MAVVTEKYKYLEAMSFIKDDFYDDKFKEPYRLIVRDYLNKNYKQIEK